MAPGGPKAGSQIDHTDHLEKIKALPIDPRLIEKMICPSCKGKLRSLDGHDGLQCVDCLRWYPISRGIQLLMVDAEDALEGPAGEPLPPAMAGTKGCRGT